MIYNTIQKDQIHALKSKDTETLDVLRYILSQFKYVQIEKQRELTDEDVIHVIRKQIKEMNESIEGFQKANRTDIVEEYEKKRQILEKYLPAEMSDDDLKKAIQQIIDEHPDLYKAKSKALIGICVKKLKQDVDPSRITPLLKTEFGI